MAQPAPVGTRVTVRVPATSANMGSGYDCVGIALDLWNEVTVEISTRFSMHIQGEGADVLPRDSTNFVVKGVEIAFKKAGIPLPPLSYFCKNDVPFGNGLGSSSAAIVSGLLAGLVLTGQTLQVAGQEELLQLAASVEGHVDNIAPCIYGGMQIGLFNGERWNTTGIATPQELQCVLFVPHGVFSTEAARSMLPDKVDRKDAIFNIARVALLTQAMCTGNLIRLKTAMQDKMHQPVRGRPDIMPAMHPCIEAALAAGAKGACLSGAGSTIIAFCGGARGPTTTQAQTERQDKVVSAAMAAAAAKVGVKGTVVITKPSVLGAHVVQNQKPPAAKGMRYRSTRSADGGNTFKHAVMRGLASDGGLFVPETIPKISAEEIASWRNLQFPSLACKIMSKYIGTDEIPSAALESVVFKSYQTFSTTHVTPLVKLSDDGTTYVLEQFHGPTAAFKDVALQFLGNLFEYFLESENADTAEGEEKRITVLGATSGDTGSAAIEGLRGKKNVEVYILHPKGRVAPVQEAQMTTVLDDNVHNISVEGSFDDCQSMVKTMFNDDEFRSKHNLAAINSINWARIMAQIVYYFYAYFRFLDDVQGTGTGGAGTGSVVPKVNFVVPSGNFGNALAGFYAREMGLGINKLVVATNQNDILYRFMQFADYTSRPVKPSLAPAMDIVVPSNFERFLFWLFDNDPAVLAGAMDSIKNKGLMSLGEREQKYMDKIHTIFEAERASDDDIKVAIEDYKMKHGYLLCPHSAAGIHALQTLEKKQVAGVVGASHICFATAHPAKFTPSVEDCRPFVPAVPVQLEGLLSKKTRCVHIKHDVGQLRALVDTDLESRSRNAVLLSLSASRSGSGGGFGVVGAFLAGAIFAIALVKSKTFQL